MSTMKIIGSTVYFNNSPVATLINPEIFRQCSYSDLEDFKMIIDETDKNAYFDIQQYEKGYSEGYDRGYDNGYGNGYDNNRYKG